MRITPVNVVNVNGIHQRLFPSLVVCLNNFTSPLVNLNIGLCKPAKASHGS